MGGVGGLSGWRYIFIWEGVLTILIGFMSAFLIVDFPQNAQRSWRFLDPREHRHIVSMLEADRKDVTSEPFRKSHLVSAVLDVKIWAFSVIYLYVPNFHYAVQSECLLLAEARAPSWPTQSPTLSQSS